MWNMLLDSWPAAGCFLVAFWLLYGLFMVVCCLLWMLCSYDCSLLWHMSWNMLWNMLWDIWPAAGCFWPLSDWLYWLYVMELAGCFSPHAKSRYRMME
jgi:hypothetical protein